MIYSVYRENQITTCIPGKKHECEKNHFFLLRCGFALIRIKNYKTLHYTKNRENVWKNRSGWYVRVYKTLVPVSRTHMTKVLAPKPRCALSERFYCVSMTNSSHLLDQYEKGFPINFRYWNVTKDP